MHENLDGLESVSRPTVSVCVATYNQCNLIEQCLRSILDQKAEAEVHVLVGDDASTDGTSEIIEALVSEYGAQLQYFRRDKNVGAFANMHDLISRADGEFVARVDGDDYWIPGKISRQLDYMNSNPECVAVYTNAITVDDAGNRVGFFSDVKDRRLDLAALLRRGNFLNNSSVVFRAMCKTDLLEMVVQLDYQVHLRHARRGWIGYIGTPFSAYRVNSSGSMVANENSRVRDLYWQAIQSVPRELVRDGDYARGLADFMRRVAFRAARKGDLSLLKIWLPRVMDASPYGRVRTLSLIVANILRMTALELLGLLPGHTPVLYRR